MKILAIGDSFTYGSELPDASRTLTSIPGTVIYNIPSKLAWPYLLAQKTSGTVDNLGMPGGSNSRIFRVAIKESLLKKYDLVICAWTHLARLDIVHHEIEFPVTLKSSEWLMNEVPWVKDFFKISYDSSHAAETWMAQLIALQDFFKHNNQQYIFLNMEGSEIFPGFLGVEKNRVTPRFAELEKRLDKTYYMGWPDTGMVDWMGDAPKGPGGHPLELGHKRIADKIYEHIGNLGWLS